MNSQGNRWFTLSLVLACTTILASAMAVYYYMNYSSSERRYNDTVAALDSLTYSVRILIKFSNGTQQWYNQTRIPIGWSFLQATNKTTGGRILGQKYSFGTFITSINGIVGNGPEFWFAYSWDVDKWVLLEIAPEQYTLGRNEIVGWYLNDGFKTP